MVAFRSSIEISDAVTLEVLLVPKWGFYAFVGANMMSLLATQCILYQHRQIQYHSKMEEMVAEQGEPAEQAERGEPAEQAEKREPAEQAEKGEPAEQAEKGEPAEHEQQPEEAKITVASQSGTKEAAVVFLLVTCVVLHFVGCALEIFEVENTRGDESFVVSYSVFSIGKEIPGTQEDPDSFGIRWIQFMYFLFAVALPPWTSILFAILYLYPMVPSVKEKVFFLSEITFSWAAVEVFVLSVIFSILQIPKFGNGLIESGCAECYRVDSALYAEFAVICVSTALIVGVNIWLFIRAHKVIFPAH